MEIKFCSNVFPTGSKYICDPPVLDTDEDYIAYTKEIVNASAELMVEGYITGTSPNYSDSTGENSTFTSYRKGHINIILTSDFDFYNQFVFATQVAKKLNLLKKEDRVTLFKAIIYGAVE